MKFTIDEFADRLRGAYPDLMDDTTSNVDLVKEYFQAYPESQYLDQLDNPDLLMASDIESETITTPEGQEIPAPPVQEISPEDKLAQESYEEAKKQYLYNGSKSAAGFLKQLVFNTAQHLSSIPSAVVGMTGWGLQGLGLDDAGEEMIDMGEDLRKWGQDLIQDIVADDIELQALQIWNEDEPITFTEDGGFGNFADWDIAKRGFASALPSMIEMVAGSYATGGMSSLYYLSKGKKALDVARVAGTIGRAKKVGGVMSGVALEGSETWNTAMEYGESQGLSHEEAADMAGLATAIAAPIKGGLEYLSFGRMARSMGLLEVGEKEMARILSGKVVSNMLVRGGIEGLKNASQEGMTEWFQFMTDAMVQEGYKQGFTADDWFNQTLDVVREEGWSDEARASIYGGFLLGKATGVAGGMSQGFGRHTPENIAKRIKEVDEWAEGVKEEYKDDPNAESIIAMSEGVRQERYHMIMAKAMEGMNEDQRKIFIQEMEGSYSPQGWGSTELAQEQDETKKDSETFETNEEKVHSQFLDSIITGGESIKMPGVENATEEQKETAEYKFWKMMDDLKAFKPKDRLLAYLKSDAQQPFVKIDNHKDKDLIYIKALKGIYDRDVLGTGFDLNKVTPEQREEIVKLWARKGDFGLKETKELESGVSEQDSGSQWQQDLQESDIAKIYENQDLTDEQIQKDIGTFIPESNDWTEKELEEWREKEIENWQPTEDDIIKEAEKEPTVEDAIEAGEKLNKDPDKKEGIPWLTQDVSKALIDKGYSIEEQSQMTEEQATEILQPPKPKQTVKELKDYVYKNKIPMAEMGSGSNGNFIKADYEQAIAEYEEAQNQQEQEVIDKAQEKVEEEVDTEIDGDRDLPPQQVERQVTTQKIITPKDTKASPDKVFIFGDNVERTGRGKGSGQAVIRDEPNSYGIATKKSPSEFMTDKEYDANIKTIDEDIAKIPKDKDVVFPEDGIGTGRASLAEKAPKTYNYLRKRLKEELGIDLPSMPEAKISKPKTKKKIKKPKEKSTWEKMKENALNEKPPKSTTTDTPQVNTQEQVDEAGNEAPPIDDDYADSFAQENNQSYDEVVSEVTEKEETDIPNQENLTDEEKQELSNYDPFSDPTEASSTGQSQSTATTSKANQKSIGEVSSEKVEVKRDKGNRKVKLKSGKEIQYNNDQQSGYDKLVKWINSGKGHFGLQGYAGTGKSTLVSDIITYIKQKHNKKVALAAPTHQAAEMLKDMGGQAITVASLMELVPNPDGKHYDRTGQHEFIPKHEANPYDQNEPYETLRKYENSFVIVDESSMLDDQTLKAMMPILDQFKIRVIYIGDDAQLPPVKQNHSSAFKLDQKEMFEQNDFTTHELRMVERQASGSPLFNIFTQLRNAIGKLRSSYNLPYTKTFTGEAKGWRTNVDKDGNGLYYTEDYNRLYEVAYKYFTNSRYNDNPNLFKIITGTHKQRAKHNNSMRQRVFGNSDVQMYDGEWMLPNESYKEEYKNSVPFRIISQKESVQKVEAFGRTYNIPVIKVEASHGKRDDGTDIIKEHTFAKNVNPKKKKKAGDTKNFYAINSNDEYMNLYNMYTAKIAQASGRNARDLRDALGDFEGTIIRTFSVEKPFTNKWGKPDVMYIEPRVDYNFATTIHKAQGTTYTNIAVDEDSIQQWVYYSQSDKGLQDYAQKKYGRDWVEADKRAAFNVRDRMIYTAFTRPQEKLFVFNQYPNYVLDSRQPQNEGERLPPLKELPPNFEYQTEGKVNYMPPYASDLITFSKILKRLKKHFPQISAKGIENILKQDGTPALGRALGLGIEWSKNARMDTVPHEYAHVYLNLFRNDPVIKKLINKFGGTEKLADYMGKYYANNMTGGLRNKIKVALKNFWLRIKKAFKGLSDKEAKEYIAGSFFMGRKLGIESKFADGQWDFNENDQNLPEYQEVNQQHQGDNPAEKHTQSFFVKELGVRIIKSDYANLSAIAQTQDVYADFEKHYKDFIRKKYPDAVVENIPESFLREFWHKAGSKIHRYDKSLGTGQLHLEVVKIDGVNQIVEKGTTYAEHTSSKDPQTGEPVMGERRELVSKSTVPETHMQSYIEMDGINVISLSLKDIVQERTNKKKEKYWVNNPQTFKMVAEEGDVNSIYIAEFEANDYVYVASKGGDHSAIIFTKVPKKYENMTWDKFEEYWLREYSENRITDEQAQDFMNSVEYGYDAEPFELSKLITQHEWWKQVKYPEYLMGTHLSDKEASKQMGVQDHYDRLKIDFSKGYTVRDFGESSVMTVNSKTSSFLLPNGDLMPLTDVDGWLLSSGEWFKKLSDSLGRSGRTGRGGMDVIKGSVRSRWTDSKGKVHYIGIKGLQMRPYKGMKVVDAQGQIIAEYVGTSDRGQWKDKDGNVFEHLSPTDASKMTNGKYSEFNKIHTLPEGYQKILQNEPDKTTSAYPVTQGEMALNKELLKTDVGKEWFGAITDYYNQIIKQYSDEITTMASDPKKLYQQLQRDVEDGDIMTELQKHLELIGPDGEGLLHPSIVPMWIDSIANKFIKKGLFKLRNRKRNMGTMMYYKPFYAPAFRNMELKQGDFIASKSNRVMVDQVLQAYEKATNQDMSNVPKNHALFWKPLNDWLSETDDNGNYKNNVPVLLSRQPIAKITGVVLRNVRHLAEGGHGQTMILTKYDVEKVFDGDWDGDKGAISVLDDPKLIKAYQKFEKSPEFKALMKAVNLKYWGKQLGGTSLSRTDHIEATINNINGGMQQIGAITNGRNTAFSMHYKNLTINLPDLGTIRPFAPTEPTIMDYLPLNVKDANFEEYFNEIYNENNDSIISEGIDGRKTKVTDYGHMLELQADPDNLFFLKTTKQHEIAIILQMGVDDSKWGLLGSFNFDSKEFMNRIMFKGYEQLKGEKLLLAKEYVNQIRSQFNLSGRRQGFNENHEKMKLKEFFEMSKNLQQFDDKEYRAIIHNQIYDNIFMKYNRGGKDPQLNMRIRKALNEAIGERILDQVNDNKYAPLQYSWNPTLQEKILLSLDEMLQNVVNPNPTQVKFAEVPFYYENGSNLQAHRRANRVINRNVNEIFGDATNKDLQAGKFFAEEFSSEYYRLFDQKDLSVDFSEEIENIIDRWMPRWNMLSEKAQILSTTQMFMGTRAKLAKQSVAKHIVADQRMRKFFPIEFQHPEVSKMYYKLWHGFLMNENLNVINNQTESRQQRLAEKAKGYPLAEANIESVTKENLEKLCE